MSGLLAAVSLSLVCSSACVQLTRFTDCGSHGTVHTISIDQCPHEPCHITGGQTYTGKTNFTSYVNSQTVTNKMQAELTAGVFLEFPMSPLNACGQGITCPVVKGETYVYSGSITPPIFSSSVRMVVKWQLQDDRGDAIICVVFPVAYTS